MNTNQTSHPDQAPASTQAQPAATPASPKVDHESGRCVFAPVACALRRGADDARQAAQKALPKVRAALSNAAYHLAYGAAYAAVFHLAVLRAACPEIIKSGASQGARDGEAAAERLFARNQSGAQGASDEVPAPTSG